MAKREMRTSASTPRHAPTSRCTEMLSRRLNTLAPHAYPHVSPAKLIIPPSWQLLVSIRTAMARLIMIRGRHVRRVTRSMSEATMRRSRALRQTSSSSIDRVVARPLAANPRLQPCRACMIWAESNLNHIKLSRAGRGRPVSKTSCKALRQHSRRDEGECRRCPPSENEKTPLLKLLD